MFSDNNITEEERKLLEASKPLYNIPQDISFSNYMKNYLYRYFHKDTENFEQYWRTNGTVPNRDQHFYQQFPKKATSLDSEHHYSNFNMYGYCSRWLPVPIVHLLFPFHSLIYDQDGNMLPLKRKLMAKEVPTSIECSICDEFKGIGIWDRKGNWCCIRQDSKLDLSQTDEMGFKFFQNFNQYRKWKKILNDKIEECYMKDKDDEVIKLEEFKKHSNIPRECIVEH